MNSGNSKQSADHRPRILVLEGLSGSGICVRAGGGVPVTVSPTNAGEVDDALNGLYGDIHGVLLTGGGDVDPALYGRAKHRLTSGISPARDLSEWVVLEEAGRRGLPIMGICRGSQIMNVQAGGKLRQHISGHRGTEHVVLAEPDSLLGRVAGERMRVVSLHHQEVSEPAPGFRIAARAMDGTAEAVESDDGRCIGVQFHPEMEEWADYSKALFRWLAVESAARAGLPEPEARPELLWDEPRSSMRYSGRREIGRSTKRSRPKHRRAGTRTAPAPVKVSWICPHCAMRFDRLVDRDDHVDFIHSPRPAATAAQRRAQLGGFDRDIWGLEEDLIDVDALTDDELENLAGELTLMIEDPAA